MAKETNRWDNIIDQLVEVLRAKTDPLADRMRGGKTAVGQRHLTRHEQLRQYMLFRTSAASLPPELQQERRELWEQRFRDRTPLERKRYTVEMERLRLQAVGATPTGEEDETTMEDELADNYIPTLSTGDR